MQRNQVGTAVLLVCVVALAGCWSSTPPQAENGTAATGPGQSSKPTAAVDSHARMVATLQEIKQKSRVDDPFFQDQTVQDQEAELAALPADASDIDRLGLHTLLSDDYRRLGKIKEAVQHTEAALKIVAQPGFTFDENSLTKIYFEAGLTYLRQGETENCIYCQTGESCILPIRQGGIHQQREGSRKAIDYFLKTLTRDPDHLAAKWLLNIAAMTLGEYPALVPEPYRLPADAFTDSSNFPRFQDISRAVGLKTVECGGGAIAEDFDNDGLIDLLTSNWDPSGQIHFYHNDGSGKFTDQTTEAGLIGLLGGIDMVQADYDNDGNIDVFVTRGAWLAESGRQPNSLLRNLGNARFRDITFDVGLAEIQFPTPTAAWGDYDNDGDLDLYVGHEAPYSQLYRNDGQTGFTNVTEEAGVINGRFTKSAVWGDYNNDRLPDLYVSNLNGDNRLFRNDGNGKFTDVAPELSVTNPQASFPTWFWDVNNDGRLDIFVASYNVGANHVAADFFNLPRKDEPDCLYLGTPGGGFVEAAADWGLNRVTQPMGHNFGDLDNDGFPDFYLGTGFPGYDGLMPNLMFLNRNGKKFEEVTFSGGFGHLQKGHGTVFADFDNDGDQDVFMQLGGAYPGDAFGDVLFENPGFGRHWLRIKLVGVKSNRCGIGARIKADITAENAHRSVYKWVNSGGTFGGNPLQQQLGLGAAQKIDVLEIYWPTSDVTQRFENVPVDGWIEVQEDQKFYTTLELKPAPFAKSREKKVVILDK